MTLLLESARQANRDVLPELFDSVYDRLRRLAFGVRARWTGDATTGTTALVHEAYLKLATAQPVAWEGGSHFYAVAAKAMRQILTDHARRRVAVKRGAGAHHRSIDDSSLGWAIRQEDAADPSDDLLALDEALERFTRISERGCRVVECRFYAGLSVAETAEALGISGTTVKRDWAFAQAWLFREVRRGRA